MNQTILRRGLSLKYPELAILLKEILHSYELSRLRRISHLGSIGFAFPIIDDFTRLEHSIGTANLFLELSSNLGLTEEDIKYIWVTLILHDIGHFPFSHSCETYIQLNEGTNHDVQTIRMIKGEFEKETNRDSINSILESHHFDIEEIVEILNGTSYITKSLGPYSFLVNSILDIDCLDSINRTSKSLGLACHDPFVLFSCFYQDSDIILIHKNNLEFISNFLRTRNLIYRNYVSNPRNLSCEAMMTKAIRVAFQELDLSTNFFFLTDEEVTSKFKEDRNSRMIFESMYQGHLFELIFIKLLEKTRPREIHELLGMHEQSISELLSLDSDDVIVYLSKAGEYTDLHIPSMHLNNESFNLDDILNLYPVTEVEQWRLSVHVKNSYQLTQKNLDKISEHINEEILFTQ